MKWGNLKISKLGLTSFRLGVAGFLLFCSLFCLSSQASISPSTAPEAPASPSSPAYPPGAALTEKLTMMLQSWVDWYKTIYLPWSETDKQWKQEVTTSWRNLSDSLKKLQAEKIALQLENETLRQQLKQAQGDKWLFGLAGLGVGAGTTGLVILLAK